MCETGQQQGHEVIPEWGLLNQLRSIQEGNVHKRSVHADQPQRLPSGNGSNSISGFHCCLASSLHLSGTFVPLYLEKENHSSQDTILSSFTVPATLLWADYWRETVVFLGDPTRESENCPSGCILHSKDTPFLGTEFEHCALRETPLLHFTGMARESMRSSRDSVLEKKSHRI